MICGLRRQLRTAWVAAQSPRGAFHFSPISHLVSEHRGESRDSLLPISFWSTEENRESRCSQFSVGLSLSLSRWLGRDGNRRLHNHATSHGRNVFLSFLFHLREVAQRRRECCLREADLSFSTWLDIIPEIQPWITDFGDNSSCSVSSIEYSRYMYQIDIVGVSKLLE